MKKIYILFCLSQLALFAQMNNHTNYIPLEHGYEYQYANFDKSWYSPLVKIERDTIYPNGKTYTNLPFQAFRFSDVRCDSSGNLWMKNDLIFPLSKEEEILIFKASALPGESWLLYKDPYLTYLDLYTECLHDTMMYIMGKERRVKEMKQYDSIGIFNYYSVAEDIGIIVETDMEAGPFYLNYAKLNFDNFGYYVDYDNPDFFPINKENEYQFVQDESGNYITGKIIKDTTVNNVKYLLYPSEILPFGYVLDSTGFVYSISKPFVNNDTVDVYSIINTWKESSTRWAIAGQKNIYEVGSEEYYGVTILNEEGYLFGKPRRVKFISLFNDNSKLLDFVLAEGLGVIYFKYPQQSAWNLNYAKIDGVKYGTLVGIDDEKEMLKNYMLSQNYPNPFNPSTTITFTMPEAGYARIKIYNTLGEEVKVLLDEYKQAGIHNITLDASDLPSGVYVYQLNVNEKSFSKKMVLMK